MLTEPNVSERINHEFNCINENHLIKTLNNKEDTTGKTIVFLGTGRI